MSDDKLSPPPLPKGWTRQYSKSQKKYYYSHAETKHTQWHPPTASEVADPYKAKKRAQDNERSERERMAHGGADGSSPKRQRTLAHSPDRSKPASSSSSKPAAAAASAASSDLFELADTTNVAIIVPFRDIHPKQQRAKHLQQFIPHMVKFLGTLQQQGQVRDFHIYIVEQSDDGRKFNRGKLLNIGFDLARKTRAKNRQSPHDVYIFHDVDLLPQDDLHSAYAHFPKSPYHIARVWDRYSNNPKYFGGVVSMSASDFKRINGTCSWCLISSATESKGVLLHFVPVIKCSVATHIESLFLVRNLSRF